MKKLEIFLNLISFVCLFNVVNAGYSASKRPSYADVLQQPNHLPIDDIRYSPKMAEFYRQRGMEILDQYVTEEDFQKTVSSQTKLLTILCEQ